MQYENRPSKTRGVRVQIQHFPTKNNPEITIKIPYDHHSMVTAYGFLTVFWDSSPMVILMVLVWLFPFLWCFSMVVSYGILYGNFMVIYGIFYGGAFFMVFWDSFRGPMVDFYGVLYGDFLWYLLWWSNGILCVNCMVALVVFLW